MRAGRIDPARFGRVAVLMGGYSAEREVSIMSGRQVLAGLCAAGIDAHPLDPRDDGLRDLCGHRFDRCFNVLHGRGGEDGAMRGFLDTLGIPCTGSGVLGSAITMDKWATKRLWRDHGLPTPDWIELRRGEKAPVDAFDRLGPVLAVKPAREGSTLGLSRVRSADELPAALEQAFACDDQVLVEPWITGRELTASILGERALPLVHIEPAADFYDFEAKYVSDATRYHCPCDLPADRESELRELCHRAFRAVYGSGWGRVDLLLDGQDKPYLLEANTVPGMTRHSLVPMAAKAEGMNFSELVVVILALTLEAA